MALPTQSDFRRGTGTLISQADWNFNIAKLIEILTDGSFDLNMNDITAKRFFGDVSNATGFPGTTENLQAGEAITTGDVLRFDNGTQQVFKADNTSLTGITNVIGIATETVAITETVSIERNAATLTGLTAGSVYYVGAAGAITTSEPSIFARRIGVSVSTNRLLLDIGIDTNGLNNFRGEQLNQKGISDVLTGGNSVTNSVSGTWYDVNDYDPQFSGGIITASIFGGAQSVTFTFARSSAPAFASTLTDIVGGPQVIEIQNTPGNKLQIRQTSGANQNLSWGYLMSGQVSTIY